MFHKDESYSDSSSDYSRNMYCMSLNYWKLPMFIYIASKWKSICQSLCSQIPIKRMPSVFNIQMQVNTSFEIETRILQGVKISNIKSRWHKETPDWQTLAAQVLTTWNPCDLLHEKGIFFLLLIWGELCGLHEQNLDDDFGKVTRDRWQAHNNWFTDLAIFMKYLGLAELTDVKALDIWINDELSELMANTSL